MNNIIRDFGTSLQCMISHKCRAVPCVAWNVPNVYFGDRYIKKMTAPSGKSYFIEVSDYNIVVWCSWRLEVNGIIIHSSHPQYASNKDGLDSLLGECIERIVIKAPFYDASFYFSSGKIFSIFCDHIHGSQSLSNWEYANERECECFYLGGGSDIEKDSTQENTCEMPNNDIVFSNASTKNISFINDNKPTVNRHPIIHDKFNSIIGSMCAKVDLRMDMFENQILILHFVKYTSIMNGSVDKEIRNKTIQLSARNCVWRLDYGNVSFCSSENNILTQTNEFKKVIHDKVSSIISTSHCGDLIINFASGINVHIFCLLRASDIVIQGI